MAEEGRNPFGAGTDLFGREELKDVFMTASKTTQNKSVSQFAVEVPVNKLRVFRDLVNKYDGRSKVNPTISQGENQHFQVAIPDTLVDDFMSDLAEQVHSAEFEE